jgi:hypothetical protein
MPKRTRPAGGRIGDVRPGHLVTLGVLAEFLGDARREAEYRRRAHDVGGDRSRAGETCCLKLELKIAVRGEPGEIVVVVARRQLDGGVLAALRDQYELDAGILAKIVEQRLHVRELRTG